MESNETALPRRRFLLPNVKNLPSWSTAAASRQQTVLATLASRKYSESPAEAVSSAQAPTIQNSVSHEEPQSSTVLCEADQVQKTIAVKQKSGNVTLQISGSNFRILSCGNKLIVEGVTASSGHDSFAVMEPTLPGANAEQKLVAAAVELSSVFEQLRKMRPSSTTHSFQENSCNTTTAKEKPSNKSRRRLSPDQDPTSSDYLPTAPTTHSDIKATNKGVRTRMRETLQRRAQLHKTNLTSSEDGNSQHLITHSTPQSRSKESNATSTPSSPGLRSSQIDFKLYFGFTDPRIQQKNYLRCQIFPIDIMERQNTADNWYIPRTLIVASTKTILAAARDKAETSMCAAAHRRPESSINTTVAFINTTSTPSEITHETLPFVACETSIMICPPRFAVDFLSTNVEQIYWLNLKGGDMPDIQKMMDRFDVMTTSKPKKTPTIPTTTNVTISLGKEDVNMAFKIREWLRESGKRVSTDLDCVDKVYTDLFKRNAAAKRKQNLEEKQKK